MGGVKGGEGGRAGVTAAAAAATTTFGRLMGDELMGGG